MDDECTEMSCDEDEFQEKEEDKSFSYLSNLSAELIYNLFSFVDSTSVVRTTQTCKRLNSIIKYNDPLWKTLCQRDYGLNLMIKTPFATIYDIYRFQTMAKNVLNIYLSERYFNSPRYGNLPGWLWTWVVLNTCAPRLPRWIANHREPYMRIKLCELPMGRIRNTWSLSQQDMTYFRPTRSERGTIYYSWRDVHRAAVRKHGSQKKLVEFFLRRCSRAKTHVEKHFNQLRRQCEPPPAPSPVVRPMTVTITAVPVLANGIPGRLFTYSLS